MQQGETISENTSVGIRIRIRQRINISTSDLAIDRKQVTDLVSKDLSKAFDSIDHMALKKLHAMGTSKEAMKWLKS